MALPVDKSPEVLKTERLCYFLQNLAGPNPAAVLLRPRQNENRPRPRATVPTKAAQAHCACAQRGAPTKAALVSAPAHGEARPRRPPGPTAPAWRAVHFGTCSFSAALWESGFACTTGAALPATWSYGTEAPRGKSFSRVCSFFSQSSSRLTLGVFEHVPLLLYILAAKTVILCLAFAGVKIYQRKRLEAKQQLEAERRKQPEKKDN